MRRDAFVPAYKQRRLERERRAAVQAAVQVAGERLRQALMQREQAMQREADATPLCVGHLAGAKLEAAETARRGEPVYWFTESPHDFVVRGGRLLTLEQADAEAKASGSSAADAHEHAPALCGTDPEAGSGCAA